MSHMSGKEIVLHRAGPGYWGGTVDAGKAAWGTAVGKEGQPGNPGQALLGLMQSRPELVGGLLMALFGGILGVGKKGGMGSMGLATLLGALGIGGGLAWRKRGDIAKTGNRWLQNTGDALGEAGGRAVDPAVARVEAAGDKVLSRLEETSKKVNQDIVGTSASEFNRWNPLVQQYLGAQAAGNEQKRRFNDNADYVLGGVKSAVHQGKRLTNDTYATQSAIDKKYGSAIPDQAVARGSAARRQRLGLPDPAPRPR